MEPTISPLPQTGAQPNRNQWPFEPSLPVSAGPFFNDDEFANIARCEETFWWYRGMRAILFSVMQPHLNHRRIGRALEAGCGTGYFSRLLQTQCNMPVMPMDFSREGLRYGAAMGLERASQGSILDLPFASGAFDLAMTFDVLQQFEPGKERRALAELSRVLARGGLLAMRVSAFQALRSRHSDFVCERQRFTRPRLRKLAEESGIRVLRCTYANTLLAPVALAKFRLWEPLTRKAAATGVEPAPPWLDRLLYRPLSWEASWLGSGRDLPFGQSLLLVGEKI
jgi:SAM-dependent methyltransferase